MKKKIAALFLSIVFVLTLTAVTAFAGEFSASFSSAAGKPGESVTIVLNLKNDSSVKDLGYTSLSYDTDALVFAGGKWNFDAFLWDCNEVDGIFVAAAASVINGDVLTLSFDIKTDAKAGDYTISGNFASDGAGLSTVITPGTITVIDDTTTEPTTDPTTLAPTTDPTTAAPTTEPTTLAPTTDPTTAAPTTDPTTLAPTTDPTTTTTKPADDGKTTTTTKPTDDGKKDTTTTTKPTTTTTKPVDGDKTTTTKPVTTTSGGAGKKTPGNPGTGEGSMTVAIAIAVAAIAGTAAVLGRKKKEDR
ncbi:MAG: LPXTG cell wall anchor domain-containing protein [Clostridia bacterium]|nr:LPXTG cell wall anchor domain-containing protein [Clostridia bacterium]